MMNSLGDLGKWGTLGTGYHGSFYAAKASSSLLPPERVIHGMIGMLQMMSYESRSLG